MAVLRDTVEHLWSAFLGLPMQPPASKTIMLRLVLGSADFGIGWGLAGLPGTCAGCVERGLPQGRWFVAAMVAGMAVYELFERAKSTAQQA